MSRPEAASHSSKNKIAKNGTRVKRGVCQFCGCNQNHACRIEDLLGDVTPCSWFNKEQTVCTNPKCIAKFKKVA